MRLSALLSVAFGLISGHDLSAVVVFGHANNSAVITSDPGAGLPWQNIGHVRNTIDGGPQGTATYLGNRWMLTAGHVVADGAQSVTFDGVTNFAIEGGSAISYAPDDIKLFRLASEPAGMAAIQLDSRPIDSATAGSVVIGFGRGRLASVPINTADVNWGGNDTIARRWGINAVSLLLDIGYDVGPVNYNYTSLVTILGSTTSEFEAGLTIYDSGTPLFQSVSGSWVLTGVGATVEQNGKSTFGTDSPFLARPPRGDANFFSPVSVVREDLLAVIPEPSTWACLLGLACAIVACLRRVR